MRMILASIFLFTLLALPAAAGDRHAELFTTLDTNKDGALSKDEFMRSERHTVNRKKAIDLFPGLKDASRLSEKELRSRLFDAMDRNHDGLLSKDEWNSVAPNIIEVRF